MGADTKIQWCDYTFNPWVGCAKVSPGCANCYAEAYDRRVGGAPKHQRLDPSKPLLRWGPGAPRTRTSKAYWRQPLRWNVAAEKLTAARAKMGLPPKRPRVFCASLADVFDSEVRSLWRHELGQLIEATPALDWLLLTKRPENFQEHLVQMFLTGEPLANVWLGVTVENQEQAERRIPLLLAQDATVRFLSCEPLLGPLELAKPRLGKRLPHERGIDWLIIGGESGAKARPFDVAWARSLVRQCRAADVAPFVKQLGARASDAMNGIAGRLLDVHPDAADLVSRRLVDPHGGDLSEWPEDVRVREFPEVRR